jgi:hypothetical protein
VWVGYTNLGLEISGDSCEQGNEPSDVIKGKEFPD